MSVSATILLELRNGNGRRRRSRSKSGKAAAFPRLLRRASRLFRARKSFPDKRSSPRLSGKAFHEIPLVFSRRRFFRLPFGNKFFSERNPLRLARGNAAKLTAPLPRRRERRRRLFPPNRERRRERAPRERRAPCPPRRPQPTPARTSPRFPERLRGLCRRS